MARAMTTNDINAMPAALVDFLLNRARGVIAKAGPWWVPNLNELGKMLNYYLYGAIPPGYHVYARFTEDADALDEHYAALSLTRDTGQSLEQAAKALLDHIDANELGV